MEEKGYYEINEINLDSFYSKIKKLSKRAKKLGCPEIKVTNKGHHFEKYSVNSIENVRKIHTIELIGTAPILGDWVFAATIENKDSKNIFRKMAGFNLAIPSRYRETDTKLCEHCSSRRYRKDTFVVFNEKTGEFKQVGRSCLKDFTGHINPHLIAKWLADVARFQEEISIAENIDENMGSHHRSETIYYKTIDALTYMAFFVRTGNGYVTKAKAMECEKTSTSSEALRQLDLRYGYAVKTRSENVYVPCQEDVDYVKEVLAWFKANKMSKTVNEFETNVQILVNEEYIEARDFALIGTIFPTYWKEVILPKDKAINNKITGESKHVGEIKDRLDFVATIIDKRIYDGTDFMTNRVIEKVVYKFVDEDANIFVWFTDNFSYEIGEIFNLRGTVKKHGEFNGICQTTLTRCFLKEVK